MKHRSLMRLICTTVAILLLGGVGSARADRFDDDLLVLINRYRVTKKLKPLASSPQLVDLAQEHSQNMQDRQTMSHEGFDERFQRAAADGARSCVENVAWNQKTPQALFTAWRKSPGHNRNMLNRKITRAGINKSGAYATFFACY